MGHNSAGRGIGAIFSASIFRTSNFRACFRALDFRALSLRRIMACATCISMCCAGLLAARLAYADLEFRRDTSAAAAEAVRMDRFAPHAAYLERLAELDSGHFTERLKTV